MRDFNMVKLTRRKQFGFYRSYYDVFNELEKDKDKLAFIQALLDKQFLGKEPELDGIAKFAYISQMHNIDTQVKGWESKTKQKLSDPSQGGSVGGSQGGSVAPSAQEEEEEKEQYVMFDKFWNYYDKKRNKDKAQKLFLKLSDSEMEELRLALPAYLESTPNKQYRKDPDVYLRNKCWNDEIIKPQAPKQRIDRL